MNSRLLVIIVTYNGEIWVRKCVESALSSSMAPDVLVIDNASTDATMDILNNIAAKNERLQVKRMESNLGFGAANNVGLRHAMDRCYDYVYLLNQDAYLEPDTLRRLVEIHSWNPSFGLLSPFQSDAEGKADSLFLKHTRIRKTTNLDIPVRVDFVMAAHWLLPISSVLKVGLFSPVFLHYGEDENWIHRLQYMGLSAGVVTSVRGIHDRSTRKSSKEQMCRRKCLIPIIQMSRPEGAWSYLRSLAWLAGCSLKNFSMIPLRSAKELFRRLPELRQARLMSMKEGAFIRES